MALQIAFQVVRKLPVHQVGRADIDADSQSFAGFPPSVHLVNRFFQHPLAQGDLQVTVGHRRQKGIGGNQSFFGVVPANQGLKGNHLTVGHAQLWLEVEFEFLVLQGSGNLHQQVPTFLAEGILAWIKNIKLVAAFLFGSIHGLVGMADQAFGVGIILRVQGDAEAGGQIYRFTRHVERLTDRAQDTLIQRLGMIALNQQNKFIAADSGDGISAAETSGEPFRHHAEGLVAEIVAEFIVDTLESVQVKIADGE